MSCCLSTSLLMNHLTEKTSSINMWFRRRFNQNLPAKLNDKELIKLEESKYIQKIGCKISKYSIEDNLKNDHFNNSEHRIEPHTVSDQNLKVKNSQRLKSGDEWELFFVIDNINSKSTVNKEQTDNKSNDVNKKNVNQDKRSEIDKLELEWNESDLEWDDDFANDELKMTFHDEDQLIDQK